jgi:hypothetical protein
MGLAYGISTGGSMVFGVNHYLEGILVYSVASHREIHSGSVDRPLDLGVGDPTHSGRQPHGGQGCCVRGSEIYVRA